MPDKLYQERQIVHHMPVRCTERKVILDHAQLREAIGNYVASLCELTTLDDQDEVVMVMPVDGGVMPLTELEVTLIAPLDTLDDRSGS